MPLNKLDTIIAVSGQLADAVATTAVLDKGGKEQNPLVRPIADKAPLLIVAKVGIGLGAAAMGSVLTKHGHKKLGRALSWLAGAAGFAAAVHNVREL